MGVHAGKWEAQQAAICDSHVLQWHCIMMNMLKFALFWFSLTLNMKIFPLQILPISFLFCRHLGHRMHICWAFNFRTYISLSARGY